MSFLNILYIVIIVFILILFMLWGFIFIFLVNQKVTYKKKKEFEKILIEGLVSSYNKTRAKTTNQKLNSLKKHIKLDSKVFWKSAYIFVKVNRVVKFTQQHQFKKIFRDLNIDKILNSKINNKDWYTKARAIWLSYEFDLKENLEMISSYRDDENTLVRREAQIALVHFLGWKSLAFFPYVTRTMSLWQQIRIIEKLKEIEGEIGLIHIDKALSSENVIIKELLMRIIKHFNFTHYKYFIVDQLFSDDWRLITVAIDTLKYFESTAEEVKEIEERVQNLTGKKKRIVISNYLLSTHS